MEKTQDEIDRDLYNLICDIWDAYRTSSKEGSLKTFNEIFDREHRMYDGEEYGRFISWFGMALAPFANRMIENRRLEKDYNTNK